MDISGLVHQLVLMFFAMGVGFLGGKAGVLGEDENKMLSSLVVNITNPLQIVASVMVGERLLTNGQVLQLTGVNFACYFLLIGLGWLLVRAMRAPEKDARIYVFLLVFSNVGYLGYPLAEALLGASARFCISIFVLGFQIFCWTYGVYLLDGSSKFRLSWDILRRPCVIAALVAYALYFSALRVPAIVGQMVDYVGNLTSPMAMLIIGSALAKLSLRTVFGDWRVYVLCAVKLVAIPLGLWVLLRGVLTHDLMLTTLILARAMPAATNSTILCYRYGRDGSLASGCVFLSTLLSLVTIPLVLTMLYRLVPTLIREGYVYIAESPLFEITCKDKTWFAYNETEKADILKTLEGKKISVARSKGLGENEPEMMWLTTMNPETRRLIKVMPEDAEKTAFYFDLLLGDNLAGRKEYIAENGSQYLEMADIS